MRYLGLRRLDVNDMYCLVVCYGKRGTNRMNSKHFSKKLLYVFVGWGEGAFKN